MPVSKLVVVALAIGVSACSAIAAPAMRGAAPTVARGGDAPAQTPAARSPEPGIEGLPPKLIGLLDSLNADRSSAHVRANVRKMLHESAARFAPAWDAFLARKQIVDPAVAKAGELAKAGDLTGARDVLDKVITPVQRDSSGGVPRTRALLAPDDAELPAVQALIAVAAKQRDYARVVEAAADLVVRRAVGTDRDDELSIWLAADQKAVVSNLWQLEPERAYTRALFRAAHEARYGGARMALAHVDGLGELGLEHAHIDEAREHDKGSHVIMSFSGFKYAKVTGSSLQWSKVTAWKEPYGCVVTNRIASIDPKTGTVRYQRDCKFRDKKRAVSLKATLAAELPEWVATSYAARVIAIVEQAGPDWVLANLRVPDLRFLGNISYAPYEPLY